jgi:dolichyl-phosphate-mannose-protein mannosyltransferase
MMSKSFQPPYLFILLGIILAFRIVLLPTPSFKIDMNTWQAWTGRLLETGFTRFYAPDYFADYLPGYLYFLWGFGWIGKLFAIKLFTPAYPIFLKALMTLADILTTYFIYKIVRRHRPTWAPLAAILYFSNPALIFNSSIWGQIDGFYSFFLLLCVYFVEEVERPLLWSISAAFTLLIKPQTIALYPLMILQQYYKTGITKTALSLIILTTTIFIIAFPFYIKNPIMGVVDQLMGQIALYPYTSLFAFNIWAIIGWWQPDTKPFFGISSQTLGTFFYAISLLAIFYPLLRSPQKLSKTSIYMIAALSFFAFFLFPTRVHERYLFPFFPFMIIAAALARSFMLYILIAVLSVIHYINLWYAYYYYNVVYDNPQVAQNSFYPLFQLAEKNYPILAWITLGIFLICLLFYYRHTSHYEKV